MELKEYAEHIAKLAKKYPKAKVIYASDPEGNSFDVVPFTPTPGHFKDGEFDDEGKVNAVCIN